jgi:murein DD-endopeptidase MepM/ murein hydrolase activator NlpD
MPHRSVSYLHNSERSPRPAKPRHAAGMGRRQGDYTFGHAGRQLRLGPTAFWAVAGGLALMTSWTVITATYFTFREDVLTRLIARQAQMQFGYEDRIAELRVQVDRISSRQLLDQEQFERKLETMLQRQSTLESRASALNALVDPGTTGTLRAPANNETTDAAGNRPVKPSPISDTKPVPVPRDRQAGIDSPRSLFTPSAKQLLKSGGGVAGVLSSLQTSLDRLETRQVQLLAAIEENYASKMRHVRGVLADLGVDGSKVASAANASGGPFVPVRPALEASPFDRQVYRVTVGHAQMDRLNRTLATIPVRKPVTGEVDLSSGYGVRIDPFLNRPAMHTGLDFRAETGDPIRATANGTVTVAGWSGGYGMMVEIDHGNGFVTRYGHMSEIEVRNGQAVRTGQILGRAGTTGRSTGPHLHYETRVDGDAVDPQKFLRAGAKLGYL